MKDKILIGACIVGIALSFYAHTMKRNPTPPIPTTNEMLRSS